MACGRGRSVVGVDGRAAGGGGRGVRRVGVAASRGAERGAARGRASAARQPGLAAGGRDAGLPQAGGACVCSYKVCKRPGQSESIFHKVWVLVSTPFGLGLG